MVFVGNIKLKFNQNSAAPKVVKKLPEGKSGIKEAIINNNPQSLNRSFSIKNNFTAKIILKMKIDRKSV